METSTFVRFVAARCRDTAKWRGSSIRFTLGLLDELQRGDAHSSTLICGACCATMAIIPLIVREWNLSEARRINGAAETVFSVEIMQIRERESENSVRW